MSFLTSVQEAVDLFRNLKDPQPIRIISNKDADGITAASILLASFKRERLTCVVTLVKQLTDDFLASLSREQYATYFFLDMGASYLPLLAEHLQRKTLFVLDHHYPDSFAPSSSQFVHINPHLHDLDGTKEVSAASIAYLFAKGLDEKNKELAHLAVIGSIGDMQEHMGFQGLNKEILQDAVTAKTMEVKQGLRLFGIHTKPLHKFLEYTTNPYMHTVTGNEAGALQFLKNAGINPKIGGKYRWASDLSKQEVERLVAALTLQQAKQPPSFLGPVYFLLKEQKTSPTRDAVEFSTLLNSCGKMGKPSLGLGVCLGDVKSKEQAILLLQHYHQELFACLKWFYAQRCTKAVTETDTHVVITADTSVRDGLIGTLVSLLSKSNLYLDGTVLIGLAAMLSDEIKVSTRVCGFKDSPIDLRKIVKEAIKKTGGKGGGHRLAAGATIPADKEQLFLQSCTTSLHKALIEERV